MQFPSRVSYSGLLALCLLGCRAGDAAPAAIKTFDSNGVKICYFVQGEGEPVVLIHGWLASAGVNWMLPGISDLLAKDHRVIGLDVRGHGLSDKPADEKAYGPELVEDVARLLDHLEIKKAHIVGYSMGGIIAGNFVSKHPDRALSLTLGGMGWFQEGSVAQWWFGQIGKNDPNAQAFAVCGRSLSKLALSEDTIKSIEVPVTVLVGSDDKLIKSLYVEPLQRVRPEWPVTEIEGGDHLTCIVKPKFKEEIETWLNRNRAKKSSSGKDTKAAPKQ